MILTLSLYKLKNLYMIKGTLTISTLRDFRIKVATCHQKCFLEPLVQKYFKSIWQISLWYNLLKQFEKYHTKNRDLRHELLT